MYGVPPRGHLQGQTRDNSNTRLSHTKKEQISMCSYIISVVYICRIISCLKGFTLLYHIPHTYGMHTYGTGKMKHAYNKDKTRSINLKR